MLRESLLTNPCISGASVLFFLFSLHALHGTMALRLHISSSANISYGIFSVSLFNAGEEKCYFFFFFLVDIV